MKPALAVNIAQNAPSIQFPVIARKHIKCVALFTDLMEMDRCQRGARALYRGSENRLVC